MSVRDQATAIDALRDHSGAFTMMAIDQRGTLRKMLARGRDVADVLDRDLIEFKADASRILTPQASGILLDKDFGLKAANNAECSVILAADVLTSSVPGGQVDVAALDVDLARETVDAFGAGALKMLVPWLPETRAQAIDLTEAFLALCSELALPGVVEGVVRPLNIAEWTVQQRSDALIAAAGDFADCQPHLYKTEVIYSTPADAGIATYTANAISERISCPWVVLSSGVPANLFADAVEAACHGGAEGFLAGRAIWAGATTAENPVKWMQTESVRVFDELITRTREAIHA